jgi:hypothetical protein
MRRTRPKVWCVVAALWLPLAPVAATDNPSPVTVTREDVEESLGTRWYGCYVFGKKLGFARLSLDRSPDGDSPGYIESTLLEMRETHIEETIEFDPEPPFTVRRGTRTEQRPSSVIKTELIHTGDGCEAVRTGDGASTRKPIEKLDYSLTDSLRPRVWLRRGPHVGDQLTIRTFTLDKLKLEPETYQLLSTEFEFRRFWRVFPAVRRLILEPARWLLRFEDS